MRNSILNDDAAEAWPNVGITAVNWGMRSTEENYLRALPPIRAALAPRS